MARERLSYRQRDLAAAIRALKAAGLDVARIEVHKGGVTIVPGTPDAAAPPEDDLEAATREMEEDLRRHAEAKKAAPTAPQSFDKYAEQLAARFKAQEIPRPCVWGRGRPCDCPWTDLYDGGKFCPRKPGGPG